MTRRKEIETAWLSKEVQSNHKYDEKSFKEAVQWADKTMIVKACSYLYAKTKMSSTEINAFRKAMEE